MQTLWKNRIKKVVGQSVCPTYLTSILGILVYIICLCSTTYSWFTGSVQVDSNTLKAADECLLSVSVYKDGTEGSLATVDTVNAATLECEEGTYTVTLTLLKESASGYLVLTVDGREYYGNYLNQNNVL